MSECRKCHLSDAIICHECFRKGKSLTAKAGGEMADFRVKRLLEQVNTKITCIVREEINGHYQMKYPDELNDKIIRRIRDELYEERKPPDAA